MNHRKMLPLLGLILLVGCADTQTGSANRISAAHTGHAMQLFQGSVTSVREVTIQDNSGNNVAGAVGGAVIGGLAGNTLGGGSGRRLATAGGAVAGAAAGQAVQSGWARSEGVELIIRPDNGNEFAVVQRLGETPFFVGQRVNVLSQGGNVVISPMLAQNAPGLNE